MGVVPPSADSLVTFVGFSKLFEDLNVGGVGHGVVGRRSARVVGRVEDWAGARKDVLLTVEFEPRVFSGGKCLALVLSNYWHISKGSHLFQ